MTLVLVATGTPANPCPDLHFSKWDLGICCPRDPLVLHKNTVALCFCWEYDRSAMAWGNQPCSTPVSASVTPHTTAQSAHHHLLIIMQLDGISLVLHLLWKTVYFIVEYKSKSETFFFFYPVFNLYIVKWCDNKNIFFKLETVSLAKSNFITVWPVVCQCRYEAQREHTSRLGKADAFQRTCLSGVTQDQKGQEEAWRPRGLQAGRTERGGCWVPQEFGLYPESVGSEMCVT